MSPRDVRGSLEGPDRNRSWGGILTHGAFKGGAAVGIAKGKGESIGKGKFQSGFHAQHFCIWNIEPLG